MKKVNEIVKLSAKRNFETIILRKLKKFISDDERVSRLFYHIVAKDKEFILEKQAYNTDALEKIVFDISELSELEKRDVLVILYKGVQWRLQSYGNDEHIMFIENREGRNGIGFVEEMQTSSKSRR